MELKESLQKIIEIEKRFDVNSLTYDGIKVWPLIRIELWVMLQGVDKYELDSKQYSLVRVLSSVVLRIFKRAPSGLVNFLSCYFSKPLGKLPKEEDVDVLFYSHAVYCNEKINNSFYDRILDPIENLTEGKYKSVKVESISHDGLEKMPRHNPTLFVNPNYHLLSKFFCNVFKRNKTSISSFNEFNEVATEILGANSLDESYFIEKLKVLNFYKSFFLKVLDRVKPKVVFLVCYYSFLNMILISACREKGIATVDVQHGKQGKHHGSYAGWTKVPVEGYDFLPDYFWAWGEESKENIMRDMPVHSPHKVLVGGNLWISQWINDFFVTGEEMDNFIQSISTYDTKILVTLQPLENPISSDLLSAISNSPRSWVWLIRLHPLISIDVKNDLIKELDETKASYMIDEPTILPLYGVLKNVDVNITSWSSVCYEALYFKVPTIIVHKNGKDLYSDYIDKKLFAYSESPDEILKIIKNRDSYFEQNENRPYIDVNIASAENVLRTILGATENND